MTNRSPVAKYVPVGTEVAMYRKIKKKADHKVGVWEADEGAYFIAQNLS